MTRRSRIALIGIGALLGLLALGLGGVYAITQARLNRVYEITPRAIEIPSDPASLSSGQEIAQFSCAGCHGADMGGQAMGESPLDGRAAAPNLTAGQGGISATYSDEDWARAIWHGVDPDGRPLIGMPSDQFGGLDSGSLGALIAYLKNVPPVDNALPETTVGLLPRVNLMLGRDPLLAAELIDHDALAGLSATPVGPEP